MAGLRILTSIWRRQRGPGQRGPGQQVGSAAIDMRHMSAVREQVGRRCGMPLRRGGVACSGHAACRSAFQEKKKITGRSPWLWSWKAQLPQAGPTERPACRPAHRASYLEYLPHPIPTPPEKQRDAAGSGPTARAWAEQRPHERAWRAGSRAGQAREQGAAGEAATPYVCERRAHERRARSP
jgi:hypothetical protein